MVIVMFPCYDARFWFQAHLVVETEPYFMLILRWIRLAFDNRTGAVYYQSVMSEYELTYLADPQLDESAKTKLDEAIDAAIAAREGNITYSSVMSAPGSRRRLHYLIGKKNVAWLRVMQVQIAPDRIAELRQDIARQEGVLRTYVLETPRRPEVAASIFDQPPAAAAPAKPAEEDRKDKKEVTTEAVEKGIERALEEEVK